MSTRRLLPDTLLTILLRFGVLIKFVPHRMQGKQGVPREGVLLYAAQVSPQFDAEIAEKGHL